MIKNTQEHIYTDIGGPADSAAKALMGMLERELGWSLSPLLQTAAEGPRS